MREVYIILFLISTFILFSNTQAQVTGFDTSYVIASSPNFDYRNPTHCTNPFENVNPTVSITNRMSYEKHLNDSTSNIIVREYDYNGYGIEIDLTNDTNILNINPSISGQGSHYLIVWESNKRGNWDLYYSIFSAGTWSQPLLLDSSGANKTNPCLMRSSFNNYYFLAFEKENKIDIKVFHNNVWLADTTLFAVDSSLSSPVFSGGYNVEFYLSYVCEQDSSSKRIHSKSIFYSPTTHLLSLGPSSILPILNPGRPSILPSFGSNITFEYDTLGNRRSISCLLPGGSMGLLADSLPGNVLKARSNHWPIVIADGISCEAFAALYKKSDSAFICAKSNYYSSTSYDEYTLFYLGDSSINSELSMGNVSYSNNQIYLKYRVVWEQEINGKTALVESYMIDINTSLLNISSSIPELYSLHQNYPNPFNPETRIKFEVAKSGFVSLKVYDISGKEVSALFKGELAPGVYEYSFDGTGLGSGVYFYKLQSRDFTETRRMVLVK